MQTEPQRRQKLWTNVNLLKKALSGCRLLPSATPIICLELPTSAQALALAENLKQQGIFAPAIRPPTVRTSRIRFSVMSTHQESQIAKLGGLIAQISLP